MSLLQELDDALGFLIGRTNLKTKCELDRAIKPFGVTAVQWMVLKRLWEKDGQLLKDLAEATYKDQANITRVVDKLEKRGLLTRVKGQNDRRTYSIHLTKEGRDLENEVMPRVKKACETTEGLLNSEDLRQLKELLNKVFYKIP